MDASCFSSTHTVTQLEKCPVKVQRSTRPFYNQTIFMNPRSKQKLTPIIVNKHTLAFGPENKNVQHKAKLPFRFPFFGQYSNTIEVSPLGYLSFGLENENILLASIVVGINGNTTDLLEGVLHSIVTYGCSNAQGNDFVVRWNHSFEAILHQDGRIDLKYYTKLLSASNVGLFFKFKSVQNTTLDFTISYGHIHIALGLSIHYQPTQASVCDSLKTCANCSSQSSECSWCHQANRCQYNYLKCADDPFLKCNIAGMYTCKVLFKPIHIH